MGYTVFMKELQALLLLLLLAPLGCREDSWQISTDTPLERTLLLFPGTVKSISLKSTSQLNKIDVGLDFDVNSSLLQLEISSGGRTFKGERVAGTFMSLIACNIPLESGRALLKIRYSSLAKSAWVAVRVAPSLSRMCTPTTPISDDYVVHNTP